MLESNHPKYTMLVGRLGVLSMCQYCLNMYEHKSWEIVALLRKTMFLRLWISEGMNFERLEKKVRAGTFGKI